jgi:hypothetical protein
LWRRREKVSMWARGKAIRKENVYLPEVQVAGLQLDSRKHNGLAIALILLEHHHTAY